MSPETLKAVQRFGAHVRRLRERRSITQDDLAERCGLSQKYISQLERGAKTPSFETILVLAHSGFGLRVGRMFDGLDPDVAEESTGLDAILAGVPAPLAKAIARSVALLATAGRRR